MDIELIDEDEFAQAPAEFLSSLSGRRIPRVPRRFDSRFSSSESRREWSRMFPGGVPSGGVPMILDTPVTPEVLTQAPVVPPPEDTFVPPPVDMEVDMEGYVDRQAPGYVPGRNKRPLAFKPFG
jgi:hypothetical protein